WKTLGLEYMFLGLEAIDEDGLKLYRKRISLDKNLEALEFARSLGIMVAINIIADPQWDEKRFEVIREWALSVPEIVNISVNTPYPGTETFHSQNHEFTTRDYRLFDIQHAVLPTKLPLETFYRELVKTQQVLNIKHLGWTAMRKLSWLVLKLLARGQTNFFKSLWSFHKAYNPALQIADHRQPAKYERRRPASAQASGSGHKHSLFILPPQATTAASAVR